MLSELLKHPKALLISIVAHIVLLGAFLLNADFSSDPNLHRQGEVAKTVKAKVVNSQQLDEQKRRKQEEQEAKRQKELEKKKRVQAEKEKAEAIKREQIEEKKRKLEAAKKKQETAGKLAEAKKKAELKKKQEAEVKRKVEQQKKQEQAEAKRKEDQERLKKLEQEQLAKQKRLEDEKKKQKAEKRLRAEQERKRQEAELKARLEAEETQRRLSSLRDAYQLAIKQKIERNWRQPRESGKMPDCEVRVIQGPGGIILKVTFGACKGGSPTYRRSIENAVYKAEPLPRPGDPVLFERELIILFKTPADN
ncbi:MAG: cell envelope integrity protein TolA [Proteobacteria bacterium]|nr:cell envelope integrity protein TolA [Pseudomonadota bacterium]